MQPIALSDDDYATIITAAQPIAPDRREAFLRQVAEALQSCRTIGPGTIYRIVVQAQRAHFDPPELSLGGTGPLQLRKLR
jgi:hypothetical protein